MKQILTIVVTGLFLILATWNITHASLAVIGTASLGSSNYNLIWDNDNNGQSVVWLDYTKSATTWQNQMTWAQGLTTTLTYSINPKYTVNWNGDWRLPTTLHVAGSENWTYNGQGSWGYNITTSEMGHLYYTELGNLGTLSVNGTQDGSAAGLKNKGEFNNLVAFQYWSATEYIYRSNPPSGHYNFSMGDGYQQPGIGMDSYSFYAMAIRSASVTPVPIPSSTLLLASALLGLVGLRRKSQN